jgi:deoxyribodipyrimidine photo-lyase
MIKLNQKERIKYLNNETLQNGDYILYWMQASPRSHYNHALEYAIEKANSMNKPLITFFGITADYPEANLRHYQFLMEGLKDTQKAMEKKNIQMVIWHKSPEIGVLELASDAVLTVMDRGYLRIQMEWEKKVGKSIDCPLIQVESNVLVPVETASPKEDYSAGTIRKKIQKELNYFMTPINENLPTKSSMGYDFDSFDLKDISTAINKLDIDQTVGPSIFKGGNLQAQSLFYLFLEEKLEYFADLRNDPAENCLSNMSPYLHFGQISPLYLALEASKTGATGTESFLEELIIRRELSMNFTHYNPNYDKFECLPDWAKNTLLEHRNDAREYNYSLDELETAKTHDKYWNAAQKEMLITGKMHGYMRMYWGKKILEWVDDPRKAYNIAIYLNDKYELDGRDPNGYAGVAWCFGKHDRAWKEREIFGKVRYMNDRGLERKFKIEHYVERIGEIEIND